MLVSPPSGGLQKLLIPSDGFDTLHIRIGVSGPG
jgi:hypothetical protein